MVGIRDDLRELLIHMSLAGMLNEELIELYGYLTEDEGQMTFLEGENIPQKLRERTTIFLDRDISKRQKVIDSQ